MKVSTFFSMVYINSNNFFRKNIILWKTNGQRLMKKWLGQGFSERRLQFLYYLEIIYQVFFGLYTYFFTSRIFMQHIIIGIPAICIKILKIVITFLSIDHINIGAQCTSFCIFFCLDNSLQKHMLTLLCCSWAGIVVWCWSTTRADVLSHALSRCFPPPPLCYSSSFWLPAFKPPRDGNLWAVVIVKIWINK